MLLFWCVRVVVVECMDVWMYACDCWCVRVVMVECMDVCMYVAVGVCVW